MEGLIEPKELYAVMVVGKQTPSVTYDNYQDAEDEAVRLTEKERQPTYILQAVGIVNLAPVIITIFKK